MEQKNNTWMWIAVIVLVVLALGLAYYYFSYTSMPGDTTGENVPTEEELGNELNSLELGDLETELGDIEKELTE